MSVGVPTPMSEPMLRESLSPSTVLAHRGLSLFQKVLLVTDGSVTELLAIYTGQTIRAQKIDQALRRGMAPAQLECGENEMLLHRKVMLVDQQKAHVYAASVFVFNRLSTRAQQRLLDSEAPIGSIWRDEKTEMYREIIDIHSESCETVARRFGLSSDSWLLSRTYVLHQGGRPMGLITEKFPSTSFA